MPSLVITALRAADAAAQHLALAALLRDAVAAGASVGFVLPLPEPVVTNYWQSVIADVAAGDRVLLVATLDGQVVGTVQLALVAKPNAAHRAEVQKLLVHTAARRQGVARALLAAVEQQAAAHGRTLLVLDTRAGDPAAALYRSAGYVAIGVIPDYARSPDGRLEGAEFFYKQLADLS